MTTIPPLTLSPKLAAFRRGTSSIFETPSFAKDNQFNLFKDQDDVSSRKRVIFTPKTLQAAKLDSTTWQRSDSTQANTTRSSISTSSIRTISRDSSGADDNNKSRLSVLSAKPTNILSTLASTPTTTNKKASNAAGEAQEEKKYRYGKRKIQYVIDSDSAEDEEDSKKIEDSESKKKHPQEMSLKKAKLSTQAAPEVSTMYLYDSKQRLHCFPVFKESDLKYNHDIQTTLKEMDIDNDCDTEHEILVNSLYQAKTDLWNGILMQKQEKASIKKKPATKGRIQSFSQDSALTPTPQEKVDSKEDEVKKETKNFWENVSQSFKGLFSGEKKKPSK